MRYLLLLLLCASLSAADAVRLRYVDDGVTMIAGTAFPIEKRVLMTACHCVTTWFGALRTDSGEVEVHGVWIPFTVKKLDLAIDAALIEVGEDLPSVCAFGDEPTKDQKCTIEGSYDGQPITTEKAKFKGVYDQCLTQPDLRLCETKRFYSGKSGGPVMSGGKVVGMVVRRMKKDNKDEWREDRGIFVPVTALKSFAGIETKPAPAPQCTTLK